MKFHCTYCGRKIESGNKLSGHLMKCPNCKAEVTVPHQQRVQTPEKLVASSNKSESHRTKGFAYRRMFLISLIACLVFGALTAIYSLTTSSFNSSQATILLTTISLGTYSMTGLCCATLIGHPQYSLLGRIGIAISMIGGLWAFVTNLFLLAAPKIFEGGSLLQGRLSFLVIAVAFAHSALLLRINTINATVQNIRYFTLGIIALFSVVLLGNIMAPEDFPKAWRLFSVLAVLDVLGTIATPLSHAATKETKAY